MSSRIEQLIDEIEEYIENCKPKFMSSTEIIVNKDEMDELIRELRMKTPDEIKRYQKIISNKEAILVMIEATKNGRPGLKIMEPIYIQNEKNEYTSYVKNLLLNFEEV